MIQPINIFATFATKIKLRSMTEQSTNIVTWIWCLGIIGVCIYFFKKTKTACYSLSKACLECASFLPVIAGVSEIYSKRKGFA